MYAIAWRSATMRLTCNKINTATPEKNAKNIAVESPRSARSMSSPCEMSQLWQFEAGRHLIAAGAHRELNLHGSPVPLQQPNCTRTRLGQQAVFLSQEQTSSQAHTVACAVAEWQAHLRVAIESALKTYLQSPTHTRRRGDFCMLRQHVRDAQQHNSSIHLQITLSASPHAEYQRAGCQCCQLKRPCKLCADHETLLVPCHLEKRRLGNSSTWRAAHPGDAHVVDQRHQRVGQGNRHRWTCNMSFSGEDCFGISMASCKGLTD